MICPKCKTEYREGFTVCSDCGTQLVEDVSKSEENKLNLMHMQNSSMNLLIRSLLIAIFAMMFIFGIIFIVNSIKYAYNYSTNFLNRPSILGDVDIYIEKSINKYLILGSILSIFGGIGAIIGIYKK